MSGLAQIIIYGNSIFLSGIELALRQRGEWPVLRLPSDAAAELDALQKGVLIYDLNDADEQFAPAFLATHPRIQVIGLDAAQGQARIWHSERHALSRLEDLSDLLADLQTMDGAAKDRHR